jgi:hypothetical protein
MTGAAMSAQRWNKRMRAAGCSCHAALDYKAMQEG